MTDELRRGICLSVLAAAPLWLIDGLVALARVPDTFASVSDIALYLGFSLCLFIVAAAVFGIAWALCSSMARGMSHCLTAARKRQSPWHRPISYGVLASPLLLYISSLLYRGHGVARYPAVVRGGPYLTAIALVCLTVLGLRFTLSVGARFQPHSGVGTFVRLTFLSLIALVFIGCYCADALLYVGLYGYLHLMLAVVAFMALALFISLVFSWCTGGTPSGQKCSALTGTALIMASIGLWVLHPRWEKREDLRHVADAYSVVESKLAKAASVFAKRDPVEELLAELARESGTPFQPTVNPGDRAVAPAGSSWMNFILVTLDAVRADHVGIYGYARNTTPHLDGFARDAFVFTNAYSISNLTPTSLRPLFTALLPHKMPAATPSSSAPFRALRDHGYTTIAINLGDFDSPYTSGLNIYFDRTAEAGYLAGKEIDDTLRTEIALSELSGIGNRRFLMWIDYTSPHVPYAPPVGFDTFGDTDMDRYDGEIAYADHEFGRLLKGLDELGLADTTVVAVTADHGEEFHEHGGRYHGRTLYNELLRVPLILRVPGEAGRKIPTEVSCIDMLPTLMDLAGVPPDREMDGVSLVPLMRGKGMYGRKAVFAEHVGNGWTISKVACIKSGWKLIHNVGEATYELYDVRSDPMEQDNQIVKNPAMASRMKGELLGYELSASVQGMGKEALSQNVVTMLVRIVRGNRSTSAKKTALRMLRFSDDRTAGLALLALLAGPDSPEVKIEALRCVMAMRENGLEIPGELVAGAVRSVLFDADDGELASEALRSLHGLRAELSCSEIIRLLQGRDPLVLEALTQILPARAGECGVENALLEVISPDNSDHLKIAAVTALGRIKSTKAIPALLSIAKGDRNLLLRQRAICALGSIGDPTPVPDLLDIARNYKELNLRIEAIKAVGMCADHRCVPPLVEMLAAPISLCTDAIWDVVVAKAAEGDGGYLVDGIQYGCVPRQRAVILEAMTRVGGEDVFLYLAREMLRQPSAGMRRVYIRALAEAGTAVDWDALRVWLSRHTKERIVDRLEEAILLEKGACAAILEEVHADFTSGAAVAWERSLSIPEISNCWADSHPLWIQAELAHRLGERAESESEDCRRKASEALMDSFTGSTNSFHKKRCLLAIGNLHHPDSAPFLERIVEHSDDPRLIGDAAVALAKTSKEAAVDTLLGLVENAEDLIIGEAGVEALGYTDSSAVIPYLIELLQNDPPPRIRAACCGALGRLLGEDDAGMVGESCQLCRHEIPTVDLIEGLAGKGGRNTIVALEVYGVQHRNARIRNASARTIRRIENTLGMQNPRVR